MTEQRVGLQSVDYVEYAVREFSDVAPIFEKMGMTHVGSRSDEGRSSRLYAQGDIRFVLTASSSPRDPSFQFSRTHGNGVMNVAYRVEDADEAFNLACRLGASGAHAPEAIRGRGETAQHRSAIHLCGDVCNAFVSYEGGGRVDDLFNEDRQQIPSHKGRMLQTIDHVTINVEKGQVERWKKFHEDVFGFSLVRTFNIRTDKTGLFSHAIRSPNGRITMPFNEPTNQQSQIQEYLDTFAGPGVQHIALHTPNLMLCLDELRGHGFKFLTVPPTYYDQVSKRVPNVTEDMKELMKYGILVDGSSKGYLLQIFTENLIGPFFFEFIQRKGDNGFGDGNFQALFEAIERDQIRRGVLA